MRIFYPLLLFCLCLVSCKNNDQKNSNSLLNPSNLSSEIFKIDITNDTILVSKKGTVIKVPKGSLTTSSGNKVDLVIKEAYSIEDMLRSGLTTTTKGVGLSSGGMIYINTKNPSSEKISGPLSIAIPTNSINPAMQLYQGKEEDGKIDWINPSALPASAQSVALEKGKALFMNNCSSCHALGKDLTGPDLAHIVKRSKKIAEKEGHNFLYEYTLNNFRTQKLSKYYRIMNCSRPAVMNLFEGSLDHKDLDELYSFIENESEIRNLKEPNIQDCIDSCATYVEVLDSLSGRLRDIAIPVPMVIEKGIEREKLPIALTGYEVIDTLVSPLQHQSLYYQFSVTNSGWFNVDMLLNQGYPENVLICSPKQTEYTRVNYYLVIPSMKAVLSGGPIKQEGRFGFFSINGTIPLPVGVKAYIIALGEFGDNIVFSKIEFEVKRRQDFELDLSIVSKDDFNKIMESINLGEAEIVANDTKNANEIRTTVKNIKEAQKLKPVNCKCDCFLSQPDEERASLTQ